MTWVIGALMLVIVAGILSSSNTWTHSVAVAFDMFAGALVTRGQLGMTISAWCEVTHKTNRAAALLRAMLNKLQANHCQLALQSDIARARTIVSSYSDHLE